MRPLASWLAKLLTGAAFDHGIRLVHAPGGVTLTGTDSIEGVTHAAGAPTADLVISAVGDKPNIEWLQDSGLELRGGDAQP